MSVSTASPTAVDRVRRRASVVRIAEETADCRSFDFEVNGRWAAQAGQHSAITVTIDGVRHMRCYSLSSVASFGERPRLTVKRQPGGLVSNWCNDELRPGDVIELSEPTGHFVVRPGRKPLLFLAAGSGITPIFAMLRYALAQRSRSATLLYVNRSPADAIFAAELEQLQREFTDRFVLHSAFTNGSRTAPDSLLSGTLAKAREADVYLCGPAGFMRTCTRVAAANGIAEDHIFSESFAPATAGEGAPDRALSVLMQRHDGTTLAITSHEGATLLHALRQSAEPLVGICGGQASCGTCRVSIAAPWDETLVAAGRSERRLLDALPSPSPAHRLACQVALASVHSGLVFAPAPLTHQ